MSERPEWYYRQSAALPFRGRGENLEVLLITSRGGRRWLPPKGIVEPDMTPAESAANEAFEEAGVRGEISAHSLGRYCQHKWGGVCRIDVFPLRVISVLPEWPEGGVRRREWLPVTEAARRVDNEALQAIIERLPELLAARRDGDPRVGKTGD